MWSAYSDHFCSGTIGWVGACFYEFSIPNFGILLPTPTRFGKDDQIRYHHTCRGTLFAVVRKLKSAGPSIRKILCDHVGGKLGGWVPDPPVRGRDGDPPLAPPLAPPVAPPLAPPLAPPVAPPLLWVYKAGA